MSISAVINTKNAEKTLERTLKSLAFVDEIIVADMASSDQTREIALKYTDTVISVPDAQYVEPARNTAIDAASGEWILLIDADEVVSDTLAKHLGELSSASNDTSAYVMARKNIVFDHWLEHSGWWPDYVLRFFKKGTVLWKNTIHSSPVVSGVTDSLPATEELALLHYNYDSIEQFIAKLNRYTTIEATSRTENTTSPVRAFRAELMRRLFYEKGLSDGAHGLAVSLLQSFYEVTVVLKQWENTGFPNALSQTKVLEEMSELRDDLNYWLATERVNSSTGLAKLYWRLRRRFLI